MTTRNLFGVTLGKPIRRSHAVDGTVWELYVFGPGMIRHQEGPGFLVRYAEIWISEDGEQLVSTVHVPAFLGVGVRNLGLDRDGFLLERVPTDHAPRDRGRKCFHLDQLIHVRALRDRQRAEAMRRARERDQLREAA